MTWACGKLQMWMHNQNSHFQPIFTKLRKPKIHLVKCHYGITEEITRNLMISGMPWIHKQEIKSLLGDYIFDLFLVTAFLSTNSSAVWHFSSLWSEVWMWHAHHQHNTLCSTGTTKATEMYLWINGSGHYNSAHHSYYLTKIKSPHVHKHWKKCQHSNPCSIEVSISGDSLYFFFFLINQFRTIRCSQWRQLLF